MNYDETIAYLYHSVPMFQKEGKSAYKEGLENTYALDKHLKYPHKNFKTIHVGGTNGKGSTSHTLAAILQAAGYRVGLYTSPHLIDFRERIRVNGCPVSKQYVIDFIEHNRAFFEPLSPSFFELTTAMAFKYFADENVDIAVIEVGLGGRLDCTNIITPELAIVTNISNDHNLFLGDSLEKIAAEKAGIIKKGIPTVIGEYLPETKPVFANKAKQVETSITYAQDTPKIIENKSYIEEGKWFYDTTQWGVLEGELGGECQLKNANTVLTAISLLQKRQLNITTEAIKSGFARVCELTGLMGRWQKLQDNPTLICDTGHNVGGIKLIVEQLLQQKYNRLRIVIGMVNDKDIDGVLQLLPTQAQYYFTQASVSRALTAEEVKSMANQYNLIGDSYPSVIEATKKALEESSQNDLIFVGGSSFIVADLLAAWI